MAVEVGTGYIRVLPSFRGFRQAAMRDLARESRGIADPVREEVEQQGEPAGEGFARRFGPAIAGGLAAAGAVGAKAFMDSLGQADAASKFQAQTGATAKVAQNSGKIAGQLYRKGITDSVEQGLGDIRAVMSSGLLPEKATNAQIESITQKARDLATTFDIDVVESTRAAGKMVKTGLAKDATGALDLIAKAYQKLGPQADDTLDTVNEYSNQFAKLGVSGPQALGLVSQGLKAGARDTDVVADAFKEFSLRATDGSKLSADGFKALGLNAEKMTAVFSKGGPEANKALGDVIRRLNSMKDPVERNAAGVALFGTQFEDLGTAFKGLDLSKATKEFGAFEGTTKKIGKAIHSGPTEAFKRFRNGVQQNLVEFVGNTAIPFVIRFQRVLMVAAGAVGVFVSALLAIRTVRAVAAGIQTIGLAARTVTTNLRFAAFAVRYYTAVGAQSAVQASRTGAAWLAASVRSGAGWVATKTRAAVAFAQTSASATVHAGRTAGAWLMARTRAGIAFAQTAASASVHAGRTGAVWVAAQGRSAVATLRATAAAVAQRVVMATVAVATRAWAAAQWLLNAAMTANPVGAVIVAVVALVAAVVIAYKRSETFRRIVQGAWRGIQLAASFAWNNVLRPIFGAFTAAMKAVAAGASWLWQKAIKPAFSGIASVVGFYIRGVRTYFGLVTAGMKAIGRAATWLWQKGIKPAWDKVVQITGNLKTGIVAAFDGAKKGIGKTWDGIKKIVGTPVNFVIKTVYMGGIKKIWDNTAGKVGLPKLPAVGELKFAHGGGVHMGGGPVRGGVPGRDSVRALYAPGEHVWTAEETRAAGGHGAVARMRSAVLGGRRVRATQGPGGIARFDKGGGLFGTGIGPDVGPDLVPDGIVKKGIEIAKDVARGALVAAATPAVEALKATIRSGLPDSPELAKALKGLPIKLIDGMMKKLKGEDDKAEAGGAGTEGALSWARSQAGKPYQWGGNGNPSWDCSGFLGAIQNVIMGKKPARSWSTFAFQGDSAPSGWKRNLKAPFRIGITNRGVGHTAGTLNGVNVESRGGDGVVVGPKARAWNDKMFQAFYGFQPSVGGMGAAASKQVQRWRGTVTRILSQLGVATQGNVAAVLESIAQESGGDPRATQHGYSDANSKSGDLARGLNQVIGSTFRAYAGPYRSKGVLDPAANIYASVAYAMDKYGSGWAAKMAAPGGYAVGTPRGGAAPGWAWVGEKGPELVRFRGGEDVLTARDSRRLAGYASGTYRIKKGDTLSELAERFKTTVSALARINGIRNPDLIYAGSTLRLGGGAGGGRGGGGRGGAPYRISQVRKAYRELDRDEARAARQRAAYEAAKKRYESATSRAAQQVARREMEKHKTALDRTTAEIKKDKDLIKRNRSAYRVASDRVEQERKDAKVLAAARARAAAEQEKAIRAAYGARTAVVRGRLDGVRARIAAGMEAYGQQRETGRGLVGLDSLSGLTNARSIVEALGGRVKSLSAFTSAVLKVKARGYSQSVIDQLVAMGPEKAPQFAQVLASASGSDIKAISAANDAALRAADSFARVTTNAMFDTGRDAGSGLLAGLRSQEKALVGQMQRLADEMVKAIKKRLGIRSPSRRLYKEVGVPSGLGPINALDDMIPEARAAADRYADALVPAPVVGGRVKVGVMRQPVPVVNVTAMLDGEVLDRRIDTRVEFLDGPLVQALNGGVVG